MCNNEKKPDYEAIFKRLRNKHDLVRRLEEASRNYAQGITKVSFNVGPRAETEVMSQPKKIDMG